MQQLNDEVNRVIEDFNKQFTKYYPGDSGFNGNDPQEPNEEVQADPEELRDWLRLMAKSIAEKTVEAVRVKGCRFGCYCAVCALCDEYTHIHCSDCITAKPISAVTEQSKLASRWLGKE